MTRQAVPGTEVAVVDQLSGEQVRQVRQLIDAVAAADDAAPFSDHVLLHLAGGTEGARSLLAHTGEQLTGFGYLDVASGGYAGAELAVHPDHRGRGTGAALLAAVIHAAPGPVRVWAHGQGTGAATGPARAAERLAERFGFQQVRSLWQMRAPLTAGTMTGRPVALPAGVTLRSFVPGQDEPAWTRLNNLAFADHPEQGGWTEQEVRLREAEDWFDPAGFLLAERAGTGLVGFHWTKVHPRDVGGPPAGRHEPIGEVYVIGVDPAEAGHGLGKALTLAGLTHLAGRGLSSVLLYVDEDNSRAIGLYEHLGFQRWNTDISYELSRGTTSPAA